MKIQNDAVVAIDYTLKNDAGDVVDSSTGAEPLYYLHGHKNIVDGLESALEGLEAGGHIEVTVPPEKGYGSYQEQLVFEVPRTDLPDDVIPQKGLSLSFESGQGPMSATIQKVKLKSVVLDANHELAGKTLHFLVDVQQVRKATKEELRHGHAHSPHGHHH